MAAPSGPRWTALDTAAALPAQDEAELGPETARVNAP
jgi:hypothetical protein